MRIAPLARISALLGCLVPAVIIAQVPSDLRAAMNARDSAILAMNVAVFDKYTADEFTVTLPDGTMRTKAERVAEMKTRKPVEYEPFTDQTVRVYGDVAVRRSVWGEGTLMVMDVWVKSGGVWRVVALQITEIKGKAK